MVTPSAPWSWTARSITRCAASVAPSWPSPPRGVTRSAPGVLGPRGAVDEKRGGVDVGRHVGERGLRHLQVGERAAEHLSRRDVRRASRRSARRAKPSAAAPTVERKTSRVAIAILNPSPPPPIRFAAGTRQPSKTMRARGCGAIVSIRSATIEARRVGLDQEGREAAGAGRLAGAGEDDVPVGDAAVGDVGLLAVEPDMVAVGRRRGGDRGDVGARLRLGEGEGGDRLAGRDVRQPAASARPCRRARPARCRAPGARRRSRRGRRARRASRGRGRGRARRTARRSSRDDRRREQPRLAQRRRPAGGRNRRRRDGRSARPPALAAKVATRSRHAAMPRLEERPAEEGEVGHQLPSKTGFRFAAKAS